MLPCQLLYDQHIHISNVKKDIPDSGTEMLGVIRLASCTPPWNVPPAPMAYRYGKEAASLGPKSSDIIGVKSQPHVGEFEQVLVLVLVKPSISSDSGSVTAESSKPC